MKYVEDNTGVFILQTKDEYRVAYTKHIDDIYAPFIDRSGKWLPNSKKILEIFKESPVFYQKENAEDYAQTIIKSLNETEYGICILTMFREYAWSSFVDSA